MMDIAGIILETCRADLAHNNRHSGYLNLYNFYMSARNYHRSTILLAPNADEGLADDNSNRITIEHQLAAYQEKVVRCCSPTDVEAFVSKFNYL